MSKSGWLYKQEKKKWTKYWFVLDKEGKLCYFNSEDSDDSKGDVNVRNKCKAIRFGSQIKTKHDPPSDVSDGKECLIELDFSGLSKDWLLCAENVQDTKAWQSALQQSEPSKQQTSKPGTSQSTTGGGGGGGGGSGAPHVITIGGGNTTATVIAPPTYTYPYNYYYPMYYPYPYGYIPAPPPEALPSLASVHPSTCGHSVSPVVYPGPLCPDHPFHYYNPRHPCCYRCWARGTGMIPSLLTAGLCPFGWFWF